jgi:hypothetical protein
MSVSLKEQLVFLKQQARQELADAIPHDRDKAIRQAAEDQVLTPQEIQRILHMSRSRYYQITRPDTNV